MSAGISQTLGNVNNNNKLEKRMDVLHTTDATVIWVENREDIIV